MATHEAEVHHKGANKVTVAKKKINKPSRLPSIMHEQTPIFNDVYAKSPIGVKAVIRSVLTRNKK